MTKAPPGPLNPKKEAFSRGGFGKSLPLIRIRRRVMVRGGNPSAWPLESDKERRQMKIFIVYLTILITLILSIRAFSADNSRCIYPSPDGYSLDASPPTAEGKIIQIRSNVIVLKPLRSSKSDASHQEQIRVDKKTQIVNFSGEHITMSGLTPGQDAYVWYEGCRMPEKGQLPYAVVVKIDPNLPKKK